MRSLFLSGPVSIFARPPPRQERDTSHCFGVGGEPWPGEPPTPLLYPRSHQLSKRFVRVEEYVFGIACKYCAQRLEAVSVEALASVLKDHVIECLMRRDTCPPNLVATWATSPFQHFGTGPDAWDKLDVRRKCATLFAGELAKDYLSHKAEIEASQRTGGGQGEFRQKDGRFEIGGETQSN